MGDAIIWYLITFGCAALFYGIGVYAQKLKKPMGFWSGQTISPSEISDIEGYNRENSKMWKLYSLWYVAAGLAEIWSTLIAVVLLFLSCSLGLGLLIAHYKRIYKNYKR